MAKAKQAQKTAPQMTVQSIIPKLVNGRAWVSKWLLERDYETHMGFLGLLARKHMAFIGGTGEAKTLLIDLLRKAMKGFTHFRLQVSRDTPTKALMSDMSLPEFVNEGKVVHFPQNYLPCADIGHLSEGYTMNGTTQMSCLGLMSDGRIRLGEQEWINDELVIVLDSNVEPSKSNGMDVQGGAQDAFVSRFSLKNRIQEDLTRASDIKLCYMITREDLMKEDPPEDAIVSKEEVLFVRSEVSARIRHDALVYEAIMKGTATKTDLKYMPLDVVESIVDFRRALRLDGDRIDNRRLRWSIETMLVNAFLNDRDQLSIQDLLDTARFWAVSDLVEDMPKVMKQLRNYGEMAEHICSELTLGLTSEFASVMNKDRRWNSPDENLEELTRVVARHVDSNTQLDRLVKKYPNEATVITRTRAFIQDNMRILTAAQAKLKAAKP